jgi:NDP-sugar pyrophosphorylase family protein
LGDVFWVLYGDSYLPIDYRAVLTGFDADRSLGLMTVLENRNRWGRSNAVFRDGRLLAYDKKAWTPEMTHIDYGAALLRREALDRIPEGAPSDLADLYHELVARGSMTGYEVTKRFYEIGSPEGLAEAEKYLSARGR